MCWVKMSVAPNARAFTRDLESGAEEVSKGGVLAQQSEWRRLRGVVFPLPFF